MEVFIVDTNGYDVHPGIFYKKVKAMTWKYFSIDEFKCPCCGRNNINKELVNKLDRARELSNRPFNISSGYRCPIHNLSVGGVNGSAHVRGLAADIVCTNSVDRFHIVKSLFDEGFLRIEVAPEWIHADLDHTKPNPVLFLPED